MSEPDLMVLWMRYINTGVWGVLAVYLSPSFIRVWHPLPDSHALYRSLFFFVALLICGFNLRALLVPNEVGAHVALYCLSVLLAASIARAARR